MYDMICEMKWNDEIYFAASHIKPTLWPFSAIFEKKPSNPKNLPIYCFAFYKKLLKIENNINTVNNSDQ